MKKIYCAVFVAALVTLISIIPNASDDFELRPLDGVRYPTAIAENDSRGQVDLKEKYALDQRFKISFNNFSYSTASQAIGKMERNAIFSPMSLYLALAMAGAGSGGKTKAEILGLLGAKDEDFLADQCNRLYNLTYKDTGTSTLKIANSIWIDHSLKVKERFLKKASANYYAEAFSVNFRDPLTESLMSAWVSQKTMGTVTPNIIISPDQLMSLFNTVYYADEWNENFELLEQEEPFYTYGNPIKCNYIGLTADGTVMQGDTFIRVSISLKGTGSVAFILPNKGANVNELLKTPDAVRAIFTEGSPYGGQINYKIPVFSYDNSLELADVLVSLGMDTAFALDADFSGMTNSFLSLSKVTQEAHFSMDEKGVEASAFTYVKPNAGAGPAGDYTPKIIDVTLDRPFIYGVLSDDHLLCFTGICMNPKAN